MRKKIVITGAVIGRVLPMLREEYDLVLLDVYDTDGAGRKIEGIQKADLVNPNRDDYRDYFKGADVVIHTAYLFSQRMNAQDPSWLSPGKAGDPCWCMPSVIITTASGASGMPGGFWALNRKIQVTAISPKGQSGFLLKISTRKKRGKQSRAAEYGRILIRIAAERQ
jgi:hypothetical protein